MPERQHSPGEVDAEHAGSDTGTSSPGSGATTATDAGEVSARRTDSPRGDALFAPAVEPEQQVEAPRGDVEATTAIPASGAPKKPSPTPRADATETVTATTPADGTPAGSSGAGVAGAGASTPPQGLGQAGPAGAAPTAGAANGTATDRTASNGSATDGTGVTGSPADRTAGTGPASTGRTESTAPTTPQATPATPVPPPSADGVPTSQDDAEGSAEETVVAPAAGATGAVGSAIAAGSAVSTTGAASPTPPAGSPAAPEPAPAAEQAAEGATGPTGTPAQGIPVFDADEQPTAVHAAVTPSAEDTQIIPRAAVPAADQPTRPTGPRDAGDPPTEQIPVTGAGVPPMPPQQRPAPTGGGDAPKGGRKKPLLIVAGVVALLAVLYVADLVLSTGNVPRGVTVAGLQMGGLSKADASERLRTEIEPRATQPVQVTAGEVESQIDPVAAGLEVDYQATVEQAGEQPLNPITRITSFFTEREVGVVNKADERSVLTALEQVKPVVDKAPVEGTVRFEGATPIAVPPVPGQQLDLQAAVGVLESDWASGAPVALPLIPEATVTTDEDVQQALQSVATPAVSGPLTIQGEGATATLQPTDIAAALSFRADAAASPKLVPEINSEALKEVATPQLAGTETPGRDAALDFSTGAPVVVPSQDGRGVDYDKTFETLVPALTTGPRTLTAVYGDQPAKLTTEQLGALGITGEISSFTTGGFAADSGRNIRRAAEQVNGTIVQPGETFSLNRLTNPRNAANGYVEAGIIENGHSARGIGGGVSQVATTLYNAAYFAGMVDVEHKEHSFYISRYPVAREATVFDDIIDVKFRNDGPTGVFIQTIWTPQNLTVKMFGTKRYEVTSETGPRTNPTEPQTLTLPAGPSCVPGRGSPGFTATDTRTMRNLETGEVTSKTRTVKYNPVPTVVCQ
jgi:vancomycin resistance protein YoaR